jgi:hypothetical protein
LLRALSDENFNADVLRGLRLRQADLDIIEVQATPIRGADDPTVLEFASRDNRVLLTHDRTTMPGFAYDRLKAGIPMAGVIVVNDRMPIGKAIEQVQIILTCCDPPDLSGVVVYVPL